MTILGIDEETFNLIENITQSLNGITQLPSLGVGAEEAGTASLQDSNLLNTTTTLKKVVTCKEEIPSSFVTVNGINAEQMSQECIDGQETNVKTKTYAFTTAENSIIILTLSSNSINDYDQYLPQFEESVKTIKISNPGDIATSQIYKKYKELELQSNK